jgi:hypothetical protein
VTTPAEAANVYVPVTDGFAVLANVARTARYRAFFDIADVRVLAPGTTDDSDGHTPIADLYAGPAHPGSAGQNLTLPCPQGLGYWRLTRSATSG